MGNISSGNHSARNFFFPAIILPDPAVVFSVLDLVEACKSETDFVSMETAHILTGLAMKADAMESMETNKPGDIPASLTTENDAS